VPFRRVSCPWRRLTIAFELIEFQHDATGSDVIHRSTSRPDAACAQAACSTRAVPPAVSVGGGAVDAMPFVVVTVSSAEPLPVGAPSSIASGSHRIAGVSAVPGHRQTVLTNLSKYDITTHYWCQKWDRWRSRRSSVPPPSHYRRLRCTRPPSAGTCEPRRRWRTSSIRPSTSGCWYAGSTHRHTCYFISYAGIKHKYWKRYAPKPRWS